MYVDESVWESQHGGRGEMVNDGMMACPPPPSASYIWALLCVWERGMRWRLVYTHTYTYVVLVILALLTRASCGSCPAVTRERGRVMGHAFKVGSAWMDRCCQGELSYSRPCFPFSLALRLSPLLLLPSFLLSPPPPAVFPFSSLPSCVLTSLPV